MVDPSVIKVGVWSHRQEPGMSNLNSTSGTMGSMIDRDDIAGKEMVGSWQCDAMRNSAK